MEINNSDIIKLIRFQINRTVTNLYKGFLNIAQDLKRDQFINDYHYQTIRKKVLDQGNDCIRELDELLDRIKGLMYNEKNDKLNGNN